MQPQRPKKSVLITGASGFIGSFLVEHALKEDMEVWAAIRPTSSRKYLTDGRIRFIELDLGNGQHLLRQIEDHRRKHGPWQHVIHAAGATKCASPEDFKAVNTEGTRNLVQSLTAAKALEGRFVFVSSLSIMGPVHEHDGREITAADTPCPNTAYGRSKLAAEELLGTVEGLDYIILRPTGVYGPRERDYFLIADSIRKHVDFAVGFRRQRITFIYVRDLVYAAFRALVNGRSGSTYLLSDGADYNPRHFGRLIQQEMGVRHVLRLTAPLWLLRAVCALGEKTARRRGKAVTLNKDKYNIMKQRNWRCDITPARRELNFTPQYDLARGVKETIAWYKKEKWI